LFFISLSFFFVLSGFGSPAAVVGRYLFVSWSSLVLVLFRLFVF